MKVQELQGAASRRADAQPVDVRWTLESIVPQTRRGKAEHTDDQALVDHVAGLIAESEEARRGSVADEFQRPLVSARRVHDALERLRSLRTVEDLERAVPGELCWAGGFERVLFSRVEGASWRPVSWQVQTDLVPAARDRFRQYVRGPEIQFVGGSVESEVIRRRMSALVSDADAASGGVAAVIGVVGSSSYIAAPVIAGDQVVALVHADTEGGRALAETDRISVQAFADGLGLAMERLSLQLQLEAQGETIRRALEAAAAAIDDVAHAPMVIAAPVEAVEAEVIGSPARQNASRLTEREREVFELLVAGATNGQIADRLTVSETTVKSHVKHILRKLHVANRAEAIAQYLKNRNGAIS